MKRFELSRTDRLWRPVSRWAESSLSSWQPSPTPCTSCQAPAPPRHSNSPSRSHGTPLTQLWRTSNIDIFTLESHFFWNLTISLWLTASFSSNLRWDHSIKSYRSDGDEVFTSLWMLHAVDLEAVYDVSGVDFPVNGDTGAGGWVWLLGLQRGPLRHWGTVQKSILAHTYIYCMHRTLDPLRIQVCLWKNAVVSDLPGIPLRCARCELEVLPLA